MATTTFQERLLNYLSAELVDDGTRVTPEMDLLESGLVDSLGVMWLLAYIERDLGIRVPPEDVTIENFRSISCISKYLADR